MSSINIAVHGALGKVGQEVLRAVTSAPDMNPGRRGGRDGRTRPDFPAGRIGQRANFRTILH